MRGEVVPRRVRVAAVRGAWMQAASCGVISFFTLSRSIGNIFCTNASSCCLNSSAGYFASTCGTKIDDGYHGVVIDSARNLEDVPTATRSRLTFP